MSYEDVDKKSEERENASPKMQGEAFLANLEVKESRNIPRSQKIQVKPLPSEKRKTFKLYVTGGLAVSLWVILLLLACFHFAVVAHLSSKLANIEPTPDDNNNASIYVKEAISATNDTAKTLYTFLGPLAAAVTGYFFEETRRESEEQ
ncbi:MAG: hypothetical protein AAGA60_32240 [Cyanobacteria bacterium P01_E01_bin.42]